MKTIGYVLIGSIVTFFTLVPTKLEEIKVVHKEITFDHSLEIKVKNKIDTINYDKDKIKIIQKELGIK